MKTALILFAVCGAGVVVTAVGGWPAGMAYFGLISAWVGFAGRNR